MIKSESTTDYCLTRGFTENGARNAELNSIKPSPSKVVSVGEVLQGQLVEGADHGVDLLPLGARGPRHLLGGGRNYAGGLVQHVLRGGGHHGDLRLRAALYPLRTGRPGGARLRCTVGLLFVHPRLVAIYHGHGEPAELLAVRGAVAVCIIVV